jgi:hypothetical protein
MVHAYENLIKEIQNDLKYLPQILNINLDNEVFTKKLENIKEFRYVIKNWILRNEVTKLEQEKKNFRRTT